MILYLILYCIILIISYYIILYHIILIISYYIILYCIISYYIILCHIMCYCIKLSSNPLSKRGSPIKIRTWWISPALRWPLHSWGVECYEDEQQEVCEAQQNFNQGWIRGIIGSRIQIFIWVWVKLVILPRNI